MKKALCTALALLLTFGLLFAFVGCGATEEEETTTVFVKTPLPTDVTIGYDEESHTVTETDYTPAQLAQNTATIFEYFNLHINEVKGVKAAVNMSQGKSISKAEDAEGNSLPYSENAYVAAAVEGLKNYMLDTPGASLDYGEDLAAFLPVKGQSYVSALTLDDVESATCKDEGEVRTITLTLKSPALPATLEKAYDMGNVDDVMAEFAKANAYLTAEQPTLTYRDCRIILTADLTTDEVTAIEYEKNIDVKTTVTGNGTLADLGTADLQFRYHNTVKYELDRTAPEA